MIATNDHDQLIADLRLAIQSRRARDEELATAEADVVEARKRARRTKEAKQLSAARRVVKLIQAQHQRAAAQLKAIENELETGLSGLPLVDAGRNGIDKRNEFPSTANQPQRPVSASAAGVEGA